MYTIYKYKGIVYIVCKDVSSYICNKFDDFVIDIAFFRPVER